MGSNSSTRREKKCGKDLSPRLTKLENEFINNGGEFKTCKIGDLFRIRPTKNYGLTNQKLFQEKGLSPVIVNSSLNNGVGGHVNLDTTEKGGVVTFSDTTTTESIFYQPDDFIGYSHVQIMEHIDNRWNKKSLLYFISIMKKAAEGKFDYGNKFNRKNAANLNVKLPYKNNEIYFEYMEKYIEELEAEHIEELEAYLQVTGLSDYKISKKEQESLDAYNAMVQNSRAER